MKSPTWFPWQGKPPSSGQASRKASLSPTDKLILNSNYGKSGVVSYPQRPIQSPQPTNKLLGVSLKYIDYYGARENLLIFGCEIPIPAIMNASLNGQFEVTIHTSAGDVTFCITQPLGGSNLSMGGI